MLNKITKNYDVIKLPLLTKKTKKMVNKKFFSLMKKNIFLLMYHEEVWLTRNH